MKVYDKATWHIDAGEDTVEVLERFKVVFKYLNDSNMLSEEGVEILDLGIDSSVSLHENLVTATGKMFLDENYDMILKQPMERLAEYFLDK